MGNSETLMFHAATRLALDLPSANAGPPTRSCTTSRLLPNSTEPVEVATAVWRMAYGNDEAIERKFDDPARTAAVAFLVGLVQEVEGRLLEGWADDPGILVRKIADAAVPGSPTDRARLCEQLGMKVPADGIAGEWLFSLARDLCASITANVLPILRVSQPLTRAETFGMARDLETLALVPNGRGGESREAREAARAARVADEQKAARMAAELEAELEAVQVAAEQEDARVAAEEDKAARVAAEQEAARVAAEREAARVATEREVARVAAEAARVAAELESARVAAELEAVKTERVAAEQEAARVADELGALEMPRLAAEASTKVRPHPVTAHPTSGTPLGRTDKENKAIAFLFASAVVLFGLSRRAKRRAS